MEPTGCHSAHSVCVFSGSGSSDQHEADNAAVLATAKIVAILQNEAAGGVPLITEVRHPRSVAYLDPTEWWPDDETDEFAYVQASRRV